MSLQSQPQPQGPATPAAAILARSRVPAGLLGVTFVILWGTGFPAARIALDHSAPVTLLVLRFGGGGGGGGPPAPPPPPPRRPARAPPRAPPPAGAPPAPRLG